MNGKVTKVYKDKGFGFIKGSDGVDYFFHRSSVRNRSFNDIRDNDEVTFEESENEKGPRAEDVYVS
jgi:CspA family cold shock protein